MMNAQLQFDRRRGGLRIRLRSSRNRDSELPPQTEHDKKPTKDAKGYYWSVRLPQVVNLPGGQGQSHRLDSAAVWRFALFPMPENFELLTDTQLGTHAGNDDRILAEGHAA